MPNDASLHSALAVEEYRALRDTIRQRGSLRLLVILVTFVSWTAAVLALLAGLEGRDPLHSVLPLVILVAGFEVVFAIHVGVERVGRYLEVFYEPGRKPDAPALRLPGWETAIAAARETLPPAGLDPLAARLFMLAIVLNLVPAFEAATNVVRIGGSGLSLGMGAILILHAAAAGRVSQAARVARGQRQQDLAAFRSLAELAP